jgi:hypothetical protein
LWPKSPQATSACSAIEAPACRRLRRRLIDHAPTAGQPAAKERIMARLRTKGSTATLLARDDDDLPMPIMPWGTVHNLVPNETTAARNSSAIAANCGVVSVIAIGGAAHFKKGDSTVVATTNDPYLPVGVWHEIPIYPGANNDFVSFLAAAGAGTIKVQIVERQ